MILLTPQVLNGGEQTAPPDWSPSTTTDKHDNDDTQSTTTANNDNDDTQSTTTKNDDNDDDDDENICVKDGAIADPKDCSRYYLCHCYQDKECVETPQACPSGLFFNPDFLYCDFPENVDCKENVSI